MGWSTFFDMFTNIYNGWLCFFGVEPHSDYDKHYVNCSESLWVVVVYVLTNAVVLVCMSTVLQLSHKILGRATEAAILAAFIVLWLYDIQINQSTIFGGNEGILDILTIVILIVGMEIYDQDADSQGRYR